MNQNPPKPTIFSSREYTQFLRDDWAKSRKKRILECASQSGKAAQETFRMRGMYCEAEGCKERATDIHYEMPKAGTSGRGLRIYCRRHHHDIHFPDEEYEDE